MARPISRDQLLDAMRTEFERLRAEVDLVARESRQIPGACDAWSVKDLLAHLDAWHEMFLQWEREGSAGGKPDIPAPGFTWKTTPALNDQIWRRTRDDPGDEVEARLQNSFEQVRQVIEGYGDDMFTKGVVPWTGSTSVGAYAVSATSSHYAWATKLIRKFRKALTLTSSVRVTS